MTVITRKLASLKNQTCLQSVRVRERERERDFPVNLCGSCVEQPQEDSLGVVSTSVTKRMCACEVGEVSTYTSLSGYE